MEARKAARRVGDIVEIDMADGTFCFGRVLEEPLMAFYDLKVGTIPSLDEIVSTPILFEIWVMNHAVTSERWPVIGAMPLQNSLQLPVTFFKQDPISKELSLYVNAQEFPATREQCKGLERAAVWDPEHVEDRLSDYFAGVPNQWVESLKIK
jgi:hypothetical protein